MTIVCVIYMYPIFMVLMNSLKVETAISTSHGLRAAATSETFAGLANYENAINSQRLPRQLVLYRRSSP